MKRNHSSLLSFLFPWLSPLVIKFALVRGGIEVQMYKNNQLIQYWYPSKLLHALPQQLTKWMGDNQMHLRPQPYPLIKQLWQSLLIHESKQLIIDSSALTELEEVRQPQDFALVWELNQTSARIEGRYIGVDNYLGMGWFQKGRKIWSLKANPPNANYSHFEHLLVPIEQADFLLNKIVPYLQQYLPTRANFKFIPNFTLEVIVSDTRNGRLVLALECNFPKLLHTIRRPSQKVDMLLAAKTIIQFPHQALTPIVLQLLQNSNAIVQGVDIPLFIREQLPILRRHSLISDDTVAKIIQSNPVVSRATLKPTISSSRTSAKSTSKSIKSNPNAPLKRHAVELDQKKIDRLHQESEQLRERLTVEDEEQAQLLMASGSLSVSVAPMGSTNQQVPSAPQTVPEDIKSTPATLQPPVPLNPGAISKLQAESEQLQERLTIETEEKQEQSHITPISVPVVKETTEFPPEVDEDWQIILQQWKPEHWEIIQLLYQEQSAQLVTVERKVRRPISRLIDEINIPVDEQLGDLLVDPETQTISPHLQTIAKSLIHWHSTSKGK